MMGIAGFFSILVFSLSYYRQSIAVMKKQKLLQLENLADEVSEQMNILLKQNTYIAMTMSSAPLITDFLKAGNREYGTLAPEKREERIKQLNQKWMSITRVEDPFIQKFINNPVGKYLQEQADILPGVYGEIFLTNRFGALVATTGKLTTLAHAHKYWWEAAYSNGTGAIFLDDRGYDKSVEGYVIGITIPIRDAGRVSGILKCNINITGPLTDVITQYVDHHPGMIRVVRTGGMIIFGSNITPLSEQLDPAMTEYLEKKQLLSDTVEINHTEYLVASKPIGVTLGTEGFTFGGNVESLDQNLGNRGEAWHIVIFDDTGDITSELLATEQQFLLIGMSIILIMTLVALLIGNSFAKPIVQLSQSIEDFGMGKEYQPVPVKDNNEVQFLSNAFHNMVQNLNRTMASRTELEKEIKKRKRVEIKLRHLSMTDHLTGILNRRAFMQETRQNISRAGRYCEPLSLIIFDIDFFKRINDKYGHARGDQVLKKLVHLAQRHIREFDILARWGGEEFILLLPNTAFEQAAEIGERFRKMVEESDIIAPETLTISLGLTAFRREDTFDTFCERADQALYKAKRLGRNRLAKG